MKIFVIFFAIIVLSTSLRVNLQIAANPNEPANATNATVPANETARANETAPANEVVNTNLTFKNGDIISIESSIIPNVYLAPDFSNCTNPNQPCGQLYGSMESSPEARFTLKELSNKPNAFCIGRDNVFIHFEAGSCAQNSTNATMCSNVKLMNSTNCTEDMAFNIQKVDESYAIESVKNPLAYLYFDVENCRGIMNQPETNATETNSTAANVNNTAINQQKCGSVQIWKIPNLAEMVNSNEDLRNALFDIMKENESS